MREFYDAIYQLRFYFYIIDEQLKFLDIAEGHRHSSRDAENIYHNDEHNAEFHIHSQSLPSEAIIHYVVYFQLAILCYLIGNLFHFFIFALRKPKVQGSIR